MTSWLLSTFDGQWDAVLGACGKVLVVVGLQGWSLWKEARGCSGTVMDSSSWCQPGPMDPPRPSASSKMYLRQKTCFHVCLHFSLLRSILFGKNINFPKSNVFCPRQWMLNSASVFIMSHSSLIPPRRASEWAAGWAFGCLPQSSHHRCAYSSTC